MAVVPVPVWHHHPLDEGCRLGALEESAHPREAGWCGVVGAAGGPCRAGDEVRDIGGWWWCCCCCFRDWVREADDDEVGCDGCGGQERRVEGPHTFVDLVGVVVVVVVSPRSSVVSRGEVSVFNTPEREREREAAQRVSLSGNVWWPFA
jgi:hypothetical protein